MILAFVLLCATNVESPARTQDVYPKVRSIIQEAEKLSIHIQVFADRSMPAVWAGKLYARAGYLQDARFAFSRAPRDFTQALLVPYVVYGDTTSADRLLAQRIDPFQKAQGQLAIADALWRMGQPDNVKSYVEQARKTALSIKDQIQRTKVLKDAEQDSEYFSGTPPNTLSADPHPPVETKPVSATIPQFPITADGFGSKTGKQREEQSREDAALLADLYGLIARGDQTALRAMIQKVINPFQKTLVIASIEHLMIQARQAAAAEQITTAIPEADAECVLAKAEALNAAGAAWLRMDDPNRANALFAKAIQLAQAADKLPIGQVAVLTTVGEAEAAGGLTATSHDTLKIAEDFALRLPLPPVPVAGKRRSQVAMHYRPEAYQQIFAVALRAHDLGFAREIAKLWSMNVIGSSYDIVSAWMEAGETAEAIDFTRNIQRTAERAETEFALADLMLDQAGAPNI